MSMSIKVSKEVYEKLQKIQRPRESYSEVIERLLMITEPLLEASRILGASHYLKSDEPVAADSFSRTVKDRTIKEG